MINVIFVCLGNICRSPMGEAVFRSLVTKEKLDHLIKVDSAGTSDWHVGKSPHEGTQKKLAEKGIATEGMKGRQFTKEDYDAFDYIVAMDRSNEENMESIHGHCEPNKVFRLLDLVEDEVDKDVPDPYFTGDFEETYNLVTKGCQALLKKIKSEHQL